MKVRILLQIAADDAEPGEAEELVSLEKRSDRLEQVGLSLAESKALLAAIQRRLVELQAEVWMKGHRHCEACGRRLRVKGNYPITFHTLFGAIHLASQRLDRCRCQNVAGPVTVSLLKDFLSDHIAPERLYLETRWASLVPYAATAELLAVWMLRELRSELPQVWAVRLYETPGSFAEVTMDDLAGDD